MVSTIFEVLGRVKQLSATSFNPLTYGSVNRFSPHSEKMPPNITEQVVLEPHSSVKVTVYNPSVRLLSCAVDPPLLQLYEIFPIPPKPVALNIPPPLGPTCCITSKSQLSVTGGLSIVTFPIVSQPLASVTVTE